MNWKRIFNMGTSLLLAAMLVYAVVQYYQNQPDITNGQKALNFEFVDLKGIEHSLEDYKGQYVFLDFWASWCKPCRRTHGDLRVFHKEFGDQNVVFISASLDNNKVAWQEAIRADELNWDNHFVDEKSGESSVSDLYDVKSIPSKFLIDPQGNIIGVNQSYRNMTKLLQDRFKD